MKATITYKGTLVISPESELEAFALRRYAEQWQTEIPCRPAICFLHEWPEAEFQPVNTDDPTRLTH